MPASKDSIHRAMTLDGCFRVLAAETTSTVQGVLDAQKAEGEIAGVFAEVVTAAVLIRECMAPDLRLQTILQSDDRRSRLVADSHPGGMTRGLTQLAKGTESFPIGAGGVLQVHRTMHNGALHQGVVGVPESGSVSSAFMRYMQESEQVITMISVGCLRQGAKVISAGGYIVQLLPEIEQAMLAVMTERLEDFRDILPLLERGAAAPRDLLAETLYGMPYDHVAESEIFFGCNCSQERLMAGIASLPRREIADLAQSREPLEVSCDFCGKEYRFLPDTLRGLLQAN